MTIEIRKIGETPKEKRFSDFIDFCSFIAISHGDKKEKETGQHVPESHHDYLSGKLSISCRRFDFQMSNKGIYHEKLQLTLQWDKKTVLEVEGKYLHGACFDLKIKKYICGEEWENVVRGHIYECDGCYSEFMHKTESTIFQEKIEDLAEQCIAFAEDKNKLTGRLDDPFASRRWFESKSRQLKIRCRIALSPYSNGYCKIVVRFAQKLVFSAEGDYGTGPYRMKVKKYIPGNWEKMLRTKKK